MDNITHTLVGAVLAEAGLKKRTALASATLMIGANFPDIDVIAVAFPNSVHWRRGVTHGFLALAILPFVLAWIMRLWDRQVRLRRDPSAAPANFRQLCVLSAVAIATHPTLDFMNTYGMRWLMPFQNKWYYADGLFIVDPWIWIALGAGVYWSRRVGVSTPARAAGAFLAAYTVVMLCITGLAREVVSQRFPGARVMTDPVPIVPWQRRVLVDTGTAYWMGHWSAARGLTGGDLVAKGENDPSVVLAKKDEDVRRFLIWARFPYYRVSRDDNGTIVHIVDARYGSEWASIRVRLP